MNVVFTCSKCGHSFSADEPEAGQWLPCPQCSALAPPPPPPMAAGQQGGCSRSSGLAIASMIVGIVAILTCWFGVVFGLVAIILGIIALVHISRSEGQLTGKGFAITGIITGGVSMLWMVTLVAGLALPGLARARSVARETACESNLRQIGQGLVAYARANNDFYPYDERGPLYSVALLFPKYIDDANVFVCPEMLGCETRMFPIDSALGGNPCSYGYNHGRLQTGDASRATPVMADMPGNHDARNKVLYFDGRVVRVPDGFADIKQQDNLFLDDPSLQNDAWLRQ